MTDAQTQPHLVTAVFRAVDPFKEVLRALIDAGFVAADISILASHDMISDHFDGTVPPPEDLADRPDTPRDNLEPETTAEAAFHAIAEGLSVIGAIGAAGAAFAVGGPVGVALGTGAAVETSVEDALSRFVETGHSDRFKQNLVDGGLVVWVRVGDDVADASARQVLSHHGGTNVHTVALP